ncbi:MATE family efflux transporter [Photobacterium ganghwense]|uniref:MATE family efflux transporter n=1 Tax=Photobacterium ganghwense TaxID=320778 RepID=UPI0039EF5DAA
MKQIVSTLSIFASSSSTFVTQLLAVWIICQEDQRALLILTVFMPFGFTLSSLSDALRAGALPVVSSHEEARSNEVHGALATLLAMAVGVFGGLAAIAWGTLPMLRPYIDLPIVTYLDFVDLLTAMTGAFLLITFSSVFTTCLFAKEKNATATSIVVIANVLQLSLIYLFAKQGHGVMSMPYAAVCSTLVSMAVALTLSPTLRELLAPRVMPYFDAMRSQFRQLLTIVVPIFSSYLLLIAWLFYITYVLLQYSDAAASAFPLYSRVQNIIIMLSIAVGVSQAIRFNKHSAEYDYSMLKNSVTQFVTHSLLYQIPVLLAVFIFSEQIAQWLINEPSVAAECAEYLRIIAPALLVLSTYVGMTVFMEQTFRSRRAFIYNLLYLGGEVVLIEVVRPYCTTSTELYTLLAVAFFASAIFILFEIGRSRYEYHLMQKMQSVTL